MTDETNADGPDGRPEGIRQHRFVAPPGATTIVLVRHGESAPEIAGAPFPQVDGHGDPPLAPGELLAGTDDHRYKIPWQVARADTFQAAPLPH